MIRVVLCAASPVAGEVSDCDPAATPSTNRRVLVQWNQIGVEQCEAVGAWSGVRASSGAEWLPIAAAGEQSYALRCTRPDGAITLHEATINGTTVVEKPLISARLSRDSLVFLPIRVGETSPIERLTLTNSGSRAISLDAPVKIGDGADSFLIESQCGAFLAAGASCDIEVTFKPTSAGGKQAQLAVGSGALKLYVGLSGSAQPPLASAGGISVSSSSVSFGEVRVGSFSWARGIVVKNEGATTVSVTPSVLGLATDEITVGNSSCLNSINAGGQCQLGLTLRPKSVGPKTGQLRLKTTTGELSVELRGQAGQSENQFICRADPAQTEPLPTTDVLDITLSSQSNPNSSTQEFWMDQIPLAEASSYQLELKWETGGSSSSTLTWPNIASSPIKACPRVSFSVTPASGSASLQFAGSCRFGLTVPIVLGSSKASMRLIADGRTASDSIVIGNAKPDKTLLFGSGGAGRVSLSWLQADGATDYVLYRIDGNSATVFAETTDLFRELSGLTEGVTYTFAIKARSAAGLSAFSNPVIVTPRSVMATNVQIDDMIINQAVEVGTGSTTKLITGKPGIVQVFLRVTGDVIGHLGHVTLASAGLEPISLVGPLMNTPVSAGAGAACVATFDLRDSAATWFASGSRSFTASSGLITSASPLPVTTSKVFNFVDERALYVKLIPVNSVRGNPTSAEIELAKVSIEKQLRAMYPNRNPQIVLSSAPYQFTGTDPGNSFLSELLPKIRDVRAAELSNKDCDRFYYALHKDNKSLGSRTAGLAYVPSISQIVANSCPWLAGVGVIEFPETVDTTAHELGHNHGRSHVSSTGETNDNCGSPSSTDTGYPYSRGRIGVTGYDSSAHRSLSKNLFHDIMGYCSRNWISDYQYRALRSFQEALSVLTPTSAFASAAKMSSEVGSVAGGVLFNGSIDAQGVWRLGSRLALSGGRTTSSDASGGFSAQVILNDGSERAIPLEIVDIDHVNRREFSIWLPNDLTAKEIAVRSRDGTVVFRLDLSAERMVAAMSTEAGYRITGRILEILPWSSGDRLVIRVRGTEREFVANDGGSETLRLQFVPGDTFEVLATSVERRLVIGPLEYEGSSLIIDPVSSAGLLLPPNANEQSVPNSVSSVLNSALSDRSSNLSISSSEIVSATGLEDGSSGVSAIEISESQDSTTSSRYVLSRSAKSGSDGFAWVVGYRSSSGALLNQWGLSPTSNVVWRRSDGSSSELPTSGWLAICSGQIWVVRDGYELLAARADSGLISRREFDVAAGDADQVTVVQSVACRGEDLAISGYFLPVTSDSPRLQSQPSRAIRFELGLSASGAVISQQSAPAEFDVGAYCATPTARERDLFCSRAISGIN